MTTEDFMKQQYLTLREEIRESKSRAFWLLILGMLLVMVAGYLAAEHPSAFANAATPFLMLVIMVAFMVEQNSIIRAGRYLREMVEPGIQEVTGWEHWLESNPRFREVDRFFFAGFIVIFLIFFAIATSLTLVQLEMKRPMPYVWSAGIAYGLGAFCVVVILLRHWRSCTTTSL